jgi:Uma2 family endonuclease
LLQLTFDPSSQLAWLIDPELKRVSVYLLGEPTQELEQPENISGEPLLRGFEIDLREIR